MSEAQRLVQKRLRVLEHAQKTGKVHKTCRYFGIARSSFYRWKSAFDRVEHLLSQSSLRLLFTYLLGRGCEPLFAAGGFDVVHGFLIS